MYEPPPNSSDVLTVEKQALAAFPLVEEDVVPQQSDPPLDDQVVFHLEPNESIEMERLVAMPGEILLAVKAKLSIASGGGMTWEATTIIQKLED